jgi:hypothetical protein
MVSSIYEYIHPENRKLGLNYAPEICLPQSLHKSTPFVVPLKRIRDRDEQGEDGGGCRILARRVRTFRLLVQVPMAKELLMHARMF